MGAPTAPKVRHRIYCNADHLGVSAGTPVPSVPKQPPQTRCSATREMTPVPSVAKDPKEADRPKRKPYPASRRPHTARIAREVWQSNDPAPCAWAAHVPLSKPVDRTTQPTPSATYWWQPVAKPLISCGDVESDSAELVDPLVQGGRRAVNPLWQDNLWEALIANRPKTTTRKPHTVCAALKAQQERVKENDRQRSSGAQTARARPATAGVSHARYDCGKRQSNWSMPQPKAVQDAVSNATDGLISVRDPDFAPTRAFQRQAYNENEAARYEGKIQKKPAPPTAPAKMSRPMTSKGNWAIRQGLIGEVGTSGGVYVG